MFFFKNAWFCEMKFFVLQGCQNDDYQRVLAWDLPRLLPQLPVSAPHTDRRGQHEGCLQTRLPAADPVL